MKEDHLKGSRGPQPRRALDTNFTNTIITTIEQAPRRKLWWTGVSMKHFSLKQPAGALVAIAAVVAIGGGAYATTVAWPHISTMLSGETTLPNGNRIVQIDTKNCVIDTDGQQTAYYEIATDSALNNQQITNMIQGSCEDRQIQHHAGKLVEAASKNGTAHATSTPTMTITSISSSAIHLELDQHQDPSAVMPELQKATFTNLSPDLTVYNGESTIAYGDLKVGDSVVIITTDNRNIRSESPNYRFDTAAMTIQSILKAKAPTAPGYDFDTHVGKDFVRVDRNADGSFSRAYEFDPSK